MENIIAIVLFLLTAVMIFFGARNWWPVNTTTKAKSEPETTPTVGTSSGAATTPTPTTSTPVATPRNYSWGWWLVIIAVVVLAWWGYKHIPTTPVSPRVSTPGMEMRQRFFVSLDPLTFNKEKSRGVRVEMDRGFMTIIVKPGGKLVYDFSLSEKPVQNGFASIDFHLREILPQYAGYWINDVRHSEEYLFGSGQTRLGPELREFQEGKNELIFFSKGELRLNGDEKIAIYQR